MTWDFTTDGSTSSVNVAPATGAVALWTWASNLIHNGWTHVESSDGSTFSAGVAQVTGGGSGAHGLGNANAWLRLRAPDGTYEICIQRGSTNLVWRAKWSHSARFTGGSPTATKVPSATDEGIINSVGGGSDASPTFSTIFSADGGYHFHCGCDAAAPYAWYWMAYDNSTGSNARRGWFVPFLAGTYPTADVAPYVVDFGGTSSPFVGANIMGSTWYKKGLSGEAWVVQYFLTYWARATAQAAPGGTGAVVNPYDGDDDQLMVPVARDGGLSTQIGWRGFVDPDQYMYRFVNRALGTIQSNGAGTKSWVTTSNQGTVIRWPVGVSMTI